MSSNVASWKKNNKNWRLITLYSYEIGLSYREMSTAFSGQSESNNNPPTLPFCMPWETSRGQGQDVVNIYQACQKMYLYNVLYNIIYIYIYNYIHIESYRQYTCTNGIAISKRTKTSLLQDNAPFSGVSKLPLEAAPGS